MPPSGCPIFGRKCLTFRCFSVRTDVRRGHGAEVRPQPISKVVPMAASVRICARCHSEKPIEAFPIKDKARGTRRSYCLPCCREYGKEHYRRNRPVYLRRTQARNTLIRPDRRAFIVEYFRTHPCVDCGIADPVVLEFDHRAVGQDRRRRAPHAHSFIRRPASRDRKVRCAMWELSPAQDPAPVRLIPCFDGHRGCVNCAPTTANSVARRAGNTWRWNDSRSRT